MPHYRRNSKAAKKQSMLQSRFVMGSLGAGLLLVLAVAWSLSGSETPVSMLMICLNALAIFCQEKMNVSRVAYVNYTEHNKDL